MSLRILVADDSPFWREHLRTVLEQDSGWTVYEASNGCDAVRKSSWIHPDVVILDFCMPELDGLGAARELKRVTPKLPVLIVTVDKNSFLEMKATQAGVLAVFSKMDCFAVRAFLSRRLQTQAA